MEKLSCTVYFLTKPRESNKDDRWQSSGVATSLRNRHTARSQGDASAFEQDFERQVFGLLLAKDENATAFLLKWTKERSTRRGKNDISTLPKSSCQHRLA